MDSNPTLESLLAQLRRHPNRHDSPDDGAFNPGFSASHTDSPVGDSFTPQMASHLPSAPTPPSGGFSSSRYPPSMLGSIGSGRPGQGSSSSGLLDLLKFSSQVGQTSQGPQNDLNQSLYSGQAAQHSHHKAHDPMAYGRAGSGNHYLHDNQAELHHSPGASNLIHAPARAPADPTGLLAALMQGSTNEPKPEQAPKWASTAENDDTQKLLLELLNRPKPSQNESSPSAVNATPQSSKDRSEGFQTAVTSDGLPTTHRLSGVANGSYDSQWPTESSHNPFDDPAAGSTPKISTPKTSTPGNGSAVAAQASPAGSLPMQILKKPSPAVSAEHKRPIESHSPVPDATPQTVASAMHDLAHKADEEAEEALARAEDQAQIAKDLESLMQAKSSREIEEAAHTAGRHLKKELDKDENRHVLEDSLPADVAEVVRDIVEEAANGPVADSWESAEVDEIVVIEEEEAQPSTADAVQVFNFPMKPWISITLQEDGKDTRIVFRDDAVLDIARLKKDFDQIDRNLVTATETYMAYGMSKAGGLRVIRQMDGKDAKLFTDTKDRVFNVAMSSTGAENDSIQKDAILGTGISGTVYWVQIRNGDKDHLEDAHPEQYGFALPPVSATEGGDAPGGVLKTRARTSSNHPEYFAVGRGKSINIVWPGFILQNQLFKPGHDRVVDTEQLTRHCALKINTGKAGKDFTFSQDDSVVVSLDKSGRVKFWDVRDLTTASEDDSHMPLNTSLEIKEPLMTLTTTPEGEKAWPTSVLLLDKLRPYQRRTALRYMIVGMKQNHTLQLWDLALGKPVQEFNLPHSKESDAVCSVMYHPASGMLVVGHPTRNSIYFLHLSAPKYALKNLSQVDYIQRLTAQDSSIPQPESTAVISGVREYSFANKGKLRSLDILQTPTASSDGDDPTLFELYAMHSKGVTCLFIKQSDLGWTKDNKVINGVDAVKTGVVKIGKLRPQQEQSEEVTQTPAPRILSARGAAANESAKASGGDDSTPKVAEGAASASRGRDEEPSTPAPAEKPEKRSRKKKAAANAAAQEPPQPSANGGNNGGNNSANNTNTSSLSDLTSTSAPSSSASGISFSQDAIDLRINAMENRLSERIASEVANVFGSVTRDIDDQFRKRDIDFEGKQRKLLDLVSQTLNNNTQQVLGRIVHEEFNKSVIPAIRDDVARLVTEQLGGKLSNTVTNTLQREVTKHLPGTVAHAIANQDLAKTIGDKLAASLAHRIDGQLESLVSDRLLPALGNMTAQAVQRASHDQHQKTIEHVAQLQHARAADSQKIDQLIGLVARLSDTVSTMAASQTQYQGEFLKMQAQLNTAQAQQSQGSHHSSQPPHVQHQQPQHHHQQRHHDGGNMAYSSPARAPAHTSPQHELAADRQMVHAPPSQEQSREWEATAEQIDYLLRVDKYDEAIMKWLQSGAHEQVLFERVLVKHSPDFLVQLQPLVLLSVGSTLSNNMTGELLPDKIAWVEVMVHAYRDQLGRLDDQTREITPKIFGHMKTRIEQVFMHITNVSRNDPALKNLAQMISIIGQIIDYTKRY